MAGRNTSMDASKKKPAGAGPRHETDVLGSNSEIGRKLKSYYGSLVSDEVPERFTQLLTQLESAEATKKKD
jgi:hypothetical protein